MAFPRHRDFPAPLLAALVLAAVALPVPAFDTISLTLGNLEGEGWSARDISVQFEWLDTSHVRLQLESPSASLPEPLGNMTGLRLECARATLTPAQLQCPAGSLKARIQGYGRQSIRIAFTYRFNDGRLEAQLRNVRLWGGSLTLDATLQEQQWQLAVSGHELPVASLSAA